MNPAITPEIGEAAVRLIMADASIHQIIDSYPNGRAILSGLLNRLPGRYYPNHDSARRDMIAALGASRGGAAEPGGSDEKRGEAPAAFFQNADSAASPTAGASADHPEGETSPTFDRRFDPALVRRIIAGSFDTGATFLGAPIRSTTEPLPPGTMGVLTNPDSGEVVFIRQP